MCQSSLHGWLYVRLAEPAGQETTFHRHKLHDAHTKPKLKTAPCQWQLLVLPGWCQLTHSQLLLNQHPKRQMDEHLRP
jgi:hypothetical protein